MTGRCKTCPHWNKQDADPGNGICSHIHDDSGLVNGFPWLAVSEKYDNPTGVILDLWTPADFGCTLHPENRGKD